MKKTVILMIALAFIPKIWSQIKVSQVSTYDKELDAKKGCFYYRLPKIIPTLNIQIEKTEYKKPQCDCYKDFIEKINKVKPMPQGIDTTSYKIISIKLQYISVPDNNKIFKVQVAPHLLKNLGWDLILDKSGLLLNGDISTEDKTADFIVEGLKTIGSVAGSVIFPKGPEIDKDSCNKFITAYQQIESNISQLLYDGSLFATRSTNSVEELKYRINELEKIKIAYFYKYVYRMDKTIITHNIPLQLDCKNFTTDTYSIHLKNDNEKIDIDQNYLNNMYKNISYNNTIAKSDGTYVIEFSKSAPIIQPYNSIDPCSNTKVHIKDNKSEHGIVYNIPQTVMVRIKKYENTGVAYIISDTTIALPQLGTFGALAQNITKNKFELSRETGEILKISGASNALLSKDQISGVGSAITSTVDKVRTNYDELLRLERERKILEEQQKIEKLKLELGL